MTDKPRIAYLSGSNATIGNSPALVTSNKARAQYGLPLRPNPDGSAPRFDVLRPQRLAAPATVYVQQFSAHPLEKDAAELYGPPDGYVDAAGAFREDRRSDTDIPVYRVELTPEDGLYPLPYMARQADGSAWEDDCAYPGAPASHSRQAYYPDGSRIFEEIDRFGMDEHGMGNLISRLADVDFYRVLPSGGYTKGLSAAERTDVGEGDIQPEKMGQDFFVYRPVHLAVSPPRGRLATIVNDVQKILDSGEYLGAIWTQGSPRVEETLYWMNLLLDTTLARSAMTGRRTWWIRSTIFHPASGRTARAKTAPVPWSSRNSRYSRHAKCRKATPAPAATSSPAVMAGCWAPSVTASRRSSPIYPARSTRISRT